MQAVGGWAVAVRQHIALDPDPFTTLLGQAAVQHAELLHFRALYAVCSMQISENSIVYNREHLPIQAGGQRTYNLCKTS